MFKIKNVQEKVNSLDDEIKRVDILVIAEPEVKTVSLREQQKINDYLKILVETTKGVYLSYEVIVTIYKRGTTLHLSVDNIEKLYFHTNERKRTGSGTFTLLDQQLFEATNKLVKEHHSE